MLNRSVDAILSLLGLSVGSMCGKEVLRLSRNKSFYVTLFNENISKLEDCQLLTKSMVLNEEDT